MDIIELHGTDKRLYELVAPLVMSPAVLRQNNNYPFKTNGRHTWHVAVERDTAAGFMPLRRDPSGRCTIDNYYVRDDDAELLHALLRAVLADRTSDGELRATVHARHAELFRREGFCTLRRWTKYERMRYGG